MQLAKDSKNIITVVDRNKSYFETLENMHISGLQILESDLSVKTDFEELIDGQDVVYHLVSTTVPTTSNKAIPDEISANVVMTSYLLEACVHKNVGKIVFLSSGGTVYGKEAKCPLNEDTPTNPITSYGLQKITIEKLIYLYHYMYGLDYRIIRLSNPYGPYQRPNGVLGAVTTFTYKALKDEEIIVYGDGSVVRDFIYIDDAIRGIQKIVEGDDIHKTFNLGSGYGTSIKQVLDTLEIALDKNIRIRFTEGRKVDVPVNYLDISRFEVAYGKLNPIPLEEGIKKTAKFMKTMYEI
jgi:UDP-glucose 4-epimerase